MAIDISETVRAGAKMSTTTFIDVDIFNRMQLLLVSAAFPMELFVSFSEPFELFDCRYPGSGYTFFVKWRRFADAWLYT